MSRMKQKYHDYVRAALQERFSYPNSMLIPILKKIIISMGIAEASKDKNAIQDCIKELSLISGQKPIMTKAKKAIANFKSRVGQPIGLKVTLRKNRMYDFFDRFCNIVAPRIRDFRGFSIQCDGKGNFSVGIEEQHIFPEINLDEIKRPQGMNITFVTSARTDDECRVLLREMGFPFKT
jgi:large subunit ribosomal protein L5